MSHSVRSRSRILSGALLATGMLSLALGAAVAGAPDLPPPVLAGPAAPALAGNRGPMQLRFSPDGRRLYVTESDEATVAVLDPAAGKVVARFSSGGDRPEGICVSPDGKLLAVANGGGDNVALLDAAAGTLVRRIPLRGMPLDVAFTADGALLAVAVSLLNEVALVDVARGEVVARVPVGVHPRALAFSPVGQLACVNTTDGTVSLIDVAARRETRRLRTPAVNLRGVAWRPDGRLLYVTAQRAQNERPTESAVGIWSNQAFAISPGGRITDNIWLDLIGKDAADPDGIVLMPDGSRAFIACAGGHNVHSIQLGGDGYDPRIAEGVGAVPRGLAISPDGREVWVANSLGNSMTALDAATMKELRRVDLGKASRVDPHLLGEYLFRTATIARGGQFSCNSCHTEGGVDGISWKFVHVQDRLGKELRNVRNLRGPLPATGPFRWTGSAPDVKEFIREEVRGLFEGPALTDAHVDALAGFITSLKLPPNPYRAEDDSLTPAARRGELLFEGKAGCAQCHAGPNRGGTRRVRVGTTPEGVELDVPHLLGVFDTAPYLHDGRAVTLEEIFEKHDAGQQHGKEATLTPEEKADLFRYLREL